MDFLKNVSVVLLGSGIGMMSGFIAAIVMLDTPAPAVIAMFVLGVILAALGTLGHAVRDALLELKKGN